MGLGHGLAGGGAVVQAEVERVGSWRQRRSQVLLGPVDPNQQARLFGGGQLLESGDRSAGNNQRVAWGDWEVVGDDGEKVVHGEKAGEIDLAEGR